MKSFKVQKNTNKQPYILGLRLPLFYVFSGILVVSVFSLLGRLTLLKFLLALLFVVASYLILRKLNSGDIFDSMANEKFPDRIINDKF